MRIPESIRKFADFFSKLPGIGPRQAIRLGFYLAESGEGARAEAEKAIESLADIKICTRCFYVHDTKGELCEICSDSSRDQSTVAIIEKETDLMSLENIGKFKGVYLVIGDIRKKSILEPGQKLRLQSLKARLKELPPSTSSGQSGGKAKEIIIAVNPTSVGNINAAAIADELKGSTEKITRLGIGIPSGGEIEFADVETLGGALERRT